MKLKIKTATMNKMTITIITKSMMMIIWTITMANRCVAGMLIGLNMKIIAKSSVHILASPVMIPFVKNVILGTRLMPVAFAN